MDIFHLISGPLDLIVHALNAGKNTDKRSFMPADMFSLKGKTALVTGGNSGIGLGMAEALTRAGADVCVWGTSGEKNRKAVETLRSHGTKVMSQEVDVGDEESVERAFAELVSAFGALHACFANAGVAGMAPSFDKMPADEWRRVLRINLDGVFFTLRAAARQMASQGSGGSIVVTGSLASMEGQPRGEHYAAAKGAIVSMVKSIAVEYARHGVRANAVIPGWIDTPMTAPFLNLAPIQQKVLTRIPLRRWGTPADFGGIAVYLASDAGAYHTGDTIVIDGGYSVF
jgi:NAD(P)-dependent dehydrogenase (short-subunit alcohol dehydrogenase family)